MHGGTQYFLDLSRIGHIWFSTKPDEFMPSLNQLRLIRKRLRNPNTEFYLIYSSKCLSKNAIGELKVFAEKLNIKLIDFDTDLKDFEHSPLDRQVYSIARLEILNAVNKTCGNMAAASDCVRLLEGFFVPCRNYVDLDVDFDFSQCQMRHPVK